MSEEQKDFNSLFSEPLDLAASVGSAEIELRKSMGNEQFDSLIAFMDASRAASVAFDQANGQRMFTMALLHAATAWALYFFCALAVCWSIFFWVLWALH